MRGLSDGASGLPNGQVGHHTQIVRSGIVHLDPPRHSRHTFPRRFEYQPT
jgi:hypothetical protein